MQLRLTKIQSTVAVLASAIIALSSLACTGGTTDQANAFEYPEVRRTDHVDDYFGTQVADPYRWMEDLDSTELASWVTSENAISRPYLESLPARERIQTRLTELWNHERYSQPFKEGDTYFYYRNDGLQNQSVLYATQDLAQEGRIVLDPNGFREDGTVSLAGTSVSPDGRYIAYGRSDGGSDWNTWHVRDLTTLEDLPDVINDTKFTTPSWAPDSKGFYYSRYPQDSDGKGDDQKAVSIYSHTIGEHDSADQQVFALPEHPIQNPYARVSDDGRFLIITIQEGYLTNAVSFRRLDRSGSKVTPLFDQWDARYNFIGNVGDTLYFTTNLDAPKERVISVDATSAVIAEVLAESEHTLDSAGLVGGHLSATYLVDAKSKASFYTLKGEHVRDVELPGIGSANGFRGKFDDPETFYSFTSFTVPSSVYRYNVATGASELFKRPAVDVDFDAYETHQLFYESKDGTRVPMFVTHAKGIELDGSHRTLLYGYGGFNISLTPSFSLPRMAWLEEGGVLAIPNLRGGGEYGKDWHTAGTKTQKQNVFDDFIAAAETLIKNGYTSPKKLAIQGGSNGGLLVGATLLQRPDLFGATLPAVGVLDMLRYHTPSANARNWNNDYGLSENEDEFRAQLAYSPVHNVDEGACYPPTLITTADHDDRVVPWHSFKFGAELQRSQGCDNPILLRVETRAGHGAGTPTWMRIEAIADQWAFLLAQLE